MLRHYSLSSSERCAILGRRGLERIMTEARFAHIKVGDTVIRLLAGTVRMPVTVFEVTDNIIKARVPEIGDDYWQFDIATGCEIDPDLGWGPPPQWTGSFLLPQGAA